jgi:hypothetical protein
VHVHPREDAAAHPYWQMHEDVQLSGQVWRLWRADVPDGEWIATAHDGNPNLHDCTVARADDRDGLMIALLDAAKKA